MQKKPVRLAVASLVAVLSVLGVSQASTAAGSVSAKTGGSWCC